MFLNTLAFYHVIGSCDIEKTLDFPVEIHWGIYELYESMSGKVHSFWGVGGGG